MEEPPLIFDGNEMPPPVMAHVLFADIVGYSKLTTDEQTHLLRRVQQIVKSSPGKHNLHDLGTAEVKHGVKLQLFNYFDAQIGNSRLPGKLSSGDSAAPVRLDGHPTGKQTRIGIIYKRGAQPDEQVVAALEQRLRALNYSVFIDRHIQVGLEWAKEIEREMRSVDAVIPVLSPPAIESEMLAMELADRG